MDCTTYAPTLSSSERPWLRLVMDSARDWFAPAPVAAVQPVRRDLHRSSIARCALAVRLHHAARAARQDAEALPIGSTDRGVARLRANMLHDAADYCMWLAGGDRDEARLALRRAMDGRRLLREGGAMSLLPIPPTAAEWHALRARHVGASEAAILFGVAPDYMPGLFSLWHIKAGRVSPPHVDNPRTRWGLLLEDAIAADAADHAADITEVHLAAALRQRRQQAAEPSNGICRACGEPIAPARLAALPSARLCITCASAAI